MERTHEVTKTIARSADFVEEAFGLIKTLETKELYHASIRADRSQIMAGLHIFAARRLINAGMWGEALGHFGEAFHLSPTAVLSAWYKYLQALGGAAGASGAFVVYRNLRRRIMHQGRSIRVSSDGIRWADSKM